MHLEIRSRVGIPLSLPLLDVRVPGPQRVPICRASFQLGKKLPQKGSRIGKDAEIRRIVAANLVCIDVDMNELAVREVP